MTWGGREPCRNRWPARLPQQESRRKHPSQNHQNSGKARAPEGLVPPSALRWRPSPAPGRSAWLPHSISVNDGPFTHDTEAAFCGHSAVKDLWGPRCFGFKLCELQPAIIQMKPRPLAKRRLEQASQDLVSFPLTPTFVTHPPRPGTAPPNHLEELQSDAVDVPACPRLLQSGRRPKQPSSLEPWTSLRPLKDVSNRISWALGCGPARRRRRQRLQLCEPVTRPQASLWRNSKSEPNTCKGQSTKAKNKFFEHPHPADKEFANFLLGLGTSGTLWGLSGDNLELGTLLEGWALQGFCGNM